MERVPFPKRAEGLCKLNEWLWDGAKKAVRENYPQGISEEMVEVAAGLILDQLARENFAKSKAGRQT